MASSPPSIIVIGAGLSGLLAARRLAHHNYDVTVLEKEPQVGGRLATRRFSHGTAHASVDFGAQYFTARHPTMRMLVDEWLSAGVIEQWGSGFATLEGQKDDFIPRYRGRDGMDRIAKHVANGIHVLCRHAATHLAVDQTGWTVTTENGALFQAETLLITTPVPITRQLLQQSNVQLPTQINQMLQLVNYDPCYALMAILDGPSGLVAPGGLWPNQGGISWMADNFQKGISPSHSVTIHATGPFTQAYLDEPPATVIQALLDEAAAYLAASPLSAELHLWSHSIPRGLHDDPWLYTPHPAPLYFAGDGFASARVEGATLSGLAVADAILGAVPAGNNGSLS